MSKQIKFKPNDWLDTKTMTIKYGIDGLYSNQWMHCSENGKPLFFDTATERDNKIKELRLA
jgi:hypothetical protein